jgi:hypothetical protein
MEGERGEANAIWGADYFLEKGISALREHDTTKALEHFNKVLELDPEYTLAHEFKDTISITELSKILARMEIPRDIRKTILDRTTQSPRHLHAGSKGKRSKGKRSKGKRSKGKRSKGKRSKGKRSKGKRPV